MSFDHGHRQRRAADLPELDEVHLEADLQQEKDDAELAEDPQHLVGTDDPEHRRADDDAGHDLPDHRGDADAIRHLRRQLGGDEDDQDVGEDACDVHLPCASFVGAPWGSGSILPLLRSATKPQSRSGASGQTRTGAGPSGPHPSGYVWVVLSYLWVISTPDGSWVCCASRPGACEPMNSG